MKLTLDRQDLKPEFQGMNCSQTAYEHFTEKAQMAISEVGRATFQEYDGYNYNAIFAPPSLIVSAGPVVTFHYPEPDSYVPDLHNVLCCCFERIGDNPNCKEHWGVDSAVVL